MQTILTDKIYSFNQLVLGKTEEETIIKTYQAIMQHMHLFVLEVELTRDLSNSLVSKLNASLENLNDTL